MLSHTVAAPSGPASFLASFTTQYLLNATASPSNGGSVNAGAAAAAGYYDRGTSVQLTAAANSGFSFANWSGNLSGTTNPQSLKMDAPHSVTANFTQAAFGPSVVGTDPSWGTGASHSFTYQFSHPAGYQNLTVVNVLINNFLDGRHACYLAYVVGTSTLVLVDDAGDAGGPYAGSVTTGNPGTAIQNSQCAVNLTSATGSGTTLTLVLNMTFRSAFSGNKIQYLGARDWAGNNTDWQAMGVWCSWASYGGGITVGGENPARGATPSGTAQTLTLSLTDSKGASDFGVVNLLVNKFIDGRRACYLAYVAVTNSLYLVDDGGDAGGPYAGSMVLNGGAGTIQNSQCSVSGVGSSAAPGGNDLTLTLNITFQSGFAGNRILWVAGRDIAGGSNTDWQAMGTWTVQ